MHKEDPSTYEDWYDLKVNDKLLASIRGKDTATWFLRHMSNEKSLNKYTLVKRDTKSSNIDDEIKAVAPW